MAVGSVVANDSDSHPLDERKQGLRQYFGANGFERWAKIYGSEKVSFIRNTVRTGHNAMTAQALAWAWESGTQQRILDAGCGPGMVSRALARAGSTVVGCDLADEMVIHAQEMAQKEPEEVAKRLSYISSDLETVHNKVEGKFDLIICLDVLIYYPEEQFAQIVKNITSVAPHRLIFTYAPASPFLRVMHRVGRLFPRGHRSTSMEIIGEAAIKRGLNTAGMRLQRQKEFNKGFYHVVLAEAVSN
jgi:magnesium-protoporphyrin O-methyltransferase